MIDIIVNGYTLPLPAGFSLTREVESTLFNKETDVYDFTYPVDIPLTNDAKRAFNFPDVMAGSFSANYPGTLVLDGVYMTGVTIKIMSVSLAAKTVKISVLGQYASLAGTVGTKKVNEMPLGGIRTMGVDDAAGDSALIQIGYYVTGSAVTVIGVKTVSGNVNTTMTAIANGTLTTDFLFPQAVDTSANVIEMDYSGENIINCFDPIAGKYVDADLYNILAQGFSTDFRYSAGSPSFSFNSEQRHWWVPMFRLGFVLRSCLQGAGLTVSGEIFDDPKFMGMVLYNTTPINKGLVDWGFYPSSSQYQVTIGRRVLTIDPRRHVPDMTISEFVYEVCKRCNLQFSYSPTEKTVVFKRISGFVNAPVSIVDLTGKVNPDATINIEQTDAYLKGYNMAFESDSVDAASGQDVADDLNKYTMLGTVNTEADLAGLAGAADTNIAFVRGLNAYYQYTADIGWGFYSHNLAAYATSTADGLQDVSTKIVSMPQQVFSVDFINRVDPRFAYWVQQVHDWNVMPFSSIGMNVSQYGHFNFEDQVEPTHSPDGWRLYYKLTTYKPESLSAPHVISWMGMQWGLSPSFYNYPCALSGAYNARGVVMDVYSGSWNNPDGKGLYPDWWDGFVKYYANSVTADWDVLLDPITYNKIDINTTLFVIDNLRWFIKKASIVMPFPAVSKLTLVRT